MDNAKITSRNKARPAARSFSNYNRAFSNVNGRTTVDGSSQTQRRYWKKRKRNGQESKIKDEKFPMMSHSKHETGLGQVKHNKRFRRNAKSKYILRERLVYCEEIIKPDDLDDVGKYNVISRQSGSVAYEQNSTNDELYLLILFTLTITVFFFLIGVPLILSSRYLAFYSFLLTVFYLFICFFDLISFMNIFAGNVPRQTPSNCNGT